MRNIAVALSMLVLGSACGESDEFGAGSVAMRKVVVNTPELQGPALVMQGPPLIVQGPTLVMQGPPLVVQGPPLVVQGPPLVVQGPPLVVQGITLNGPPLVVQGTDLLVKEMHLEGSVLVAVVEKDGVDYTLSGLDFIGAEFSLRMTFESEGEVIITDMVLRIDNVTQSPLQPDVYLYDMTYREKTSPTWLSYCGSPGVHAIPLENSWDLQTGDRIDNDQLMTFACTNAVLAKCVLWGYRPWATAESCDGKCKKEVCSEISLQDHHQACTRMARADYCGDGQPSTVEGTLIDIWDELADPLQIPGTDWPVEAEWSPDGATCLNYMRHPEFGYPACFTKKNGKPVKSKGCEGKLEGDALLGSAYSSDPP